MAAISSEQIRVAISDILKGADLNQLSAKKVRRQLEEKFNSDFTHRKKEIDNMLMDLIAKQQAKKESPKKTQKQNQKNGKSDDDDSISDDEEDEEKEEESDFEAPEDLEPPTKKAKKSKKGNNDEELARKLQDEESGLRLRHRAAANKRTPKAKKAKPADGEQKKRKGTSTYSKPCALSQDLAAVMGCDKMPRSEVVKKMWDIVRSRNLQDPKNKQFMLCDDELMKVFGVKRLRTFGMMKYLKAHIKDINELTDS